MGWEELQPLRQGAPLSRLAQRDCLEGGGWREWNKGLLMGTFPGPGRGWEHPDIRVRPLLPLHLELDSNLRVGGRGRESPRVLFPSPSRPGSPASQRPSRPEHARARTHTPAGLTIAHTYIHTQQQTKGLDTLSPFALPLRRGRGIPSPGPLQGKFLSASCGGEKDPAPRREGTRMEGFPRSPRMPSPGMPFEGFKPASGLGDVWGGPRMLGIPW